MKLFLWILRKKNSLHVRCIDTNLEIEIDNCALNVSFRGARCPTVAKGLSRRANACNRKFARIKIRDIIER